MSFLKVRSPEGMALKFFLLLNLPVFFSLHQAPLSSCYARNKLWEPVNCATTATGWQRKMATKGSFTLPAHDEAMWYQTHDSSDHF